MVARAQPLGDGQEGLQIANGAKVYEKNLQICVRQTVRLSRRRLNYAGIAAAYKGCLLQRFGGVASGRRDDGRTLLFYILPA